METSCPSIPIPKQREDLSIAWFNAILTSHNIQVSGIKFLGDGKWEGRGFLSTLERVQLEIVGNKHPLTLILKTLPQDPDVRKYVIDAGFITREVNMYVKVFKDIDTFLDSRNVPTNHRFRRPFCYYGAERGSAESYEMVLVLEDMLDSGFQVWEPGHSQNLDVDRIMATLYETALFHAGFIGYGISNGIRNYLDVYPFLLDGTKDDPNLQSYIDSGFGVVIDMLKEESKDSPAPPGLIQRMRDLSLVLPTMVKQVFGKNFGFPCIRHHDLHSGNIFFTSQTGGGEGNPMQACLIDFQACVNDTPINDVSFFLQSCCGMEDSLANVDPILEYYHSVLMGALGEMNVQFSYPIEKIKNDYRESIQLSLMHITASAVHLWSEGNQSNKVSKNRLRESLVWAYNENLL